LLEIDQGDILNQMEPQNNLNKPKFPLWMVGVAVVLIGLGILSGYFLTKGKVLGKATGASQVEIKVTKDEAGINNPAALKDTATGDLVEGGISGEGTHHLIVPGGPAHYVYLTSTVIDLQSFVGKKVQVWGLTVSGKKAGWLMDVGKVQVLQ